VTIYKYLKRYLQEGDCIAKNPPTGDNRRIGAVKDRSQTYNPKTDQWVKRDTTTGRFMDVRAGNLLRELEKKNKVSHAGIFQAYAIV
jgi:hypothetical protein